MQQRSFADETQSSILETAKTHLRRFGEDKMKVFGGKRGGRHAKVIGQ
jgi:hypothetical protein